MMSEINYRQCKRCKEFYPEEFFPIIQRKIVSNALLTIRRQKKCQGCRDTARDEKKATNRFIKKAQTTIERHGDNAIKAGWAKDLDEFRSLYGWDVKRIAEDMKHAFDGTCGICGKLFKKMRNAEGDLTVDIIDPLAAPLYGVNTQLICMTDNRRKARTPPAIYAVIMLGYRIYDALQQRLKEDEWAGTLFEGIGKTKQQKMDLD